MLYFSSGETTSSLDVFVTDTNGFPVTPFAIAYGIYRKEGSELHLVSGSAEMPPQTDAIGHYMSGWLVPESPLAGEHRVIWKIQQDTDSPIDTAQQDFTVGITDLTAVKYGDAIHGLIMKLRTLLRDCVGGETLVELDVGGEKLVVSMEDLYEAIHGDD